MKPTNLLQVLAMLLVFAVPALADVETETVLDGLDNPCGVAIQPETGTVFVADSAAGRIVRVVDGKAQEVIVGFPQDVYGKGPKFNIGPLGLTFIGKDTLVVGGGGFPDGEELLRVYNVPAAGGEAIKADDMVSSHSLAPTDEIKGEGNFYGVAANKNSIFVTCNGDDTKGWVSRARIKDGKVANFKRFLPTKEATEVDAPVAATISDRGELVIGQCGEVNVAEDSLLTFYNAKSGKMLLNLETGLYDITALAYSPKGQLYATDFAWMDTAEGGLFQLIKDGKDAVKLKKITSLDKPTSMTFDGDGNLYITVFGTAEEGSDAKPGKLLKIKAGL